MKPVENADAHRLEVVLAFTNKTTASTLRGFKVFMLESATIRLDRGDNSSMGEAVTLDNTRNEVKEVIRYWEISCMVKCQY